MAIDSTSEGKGVGLKLTRSHGKLVVDPSALPTLLTAPEVAELSRLPSTKVVFVLAASGALPPGGGRGSLPRPSRRAPASSLSDVIW